MRLSLIVAVADDGVIGLAGGLPWRLSADLQRFRHLTLGHHLLMGRKTYESIGRPLPGRTTIVITRDPDYVAPGCLVAQSLEQAAQLAAADSEAFVVGGREIYAVALPRVSRLYWTQVHARVQGDTRFPDIDWQDWRLLEEYSQPADERNEFPATFRVFERRS